MAAPYRFYVDPAWRRELPHIPLLFPFWGNALTERTPYQRALFLRHQFDTTRYTITSNTEESDAVLAPYRHQVMLRHAPELVDECAVKAAALGKPLLIDGTGDIESPIDLPHAHVLRYGGYRFLRRPNEISIPLYADDLLEASGRAPEFRQWQPMPSVGFSGWTTLTPLQEASARVKELPDRVRALWDARYLAHRKGVFFRRQAIRALEASGKVEARIIKRPSYSGHIATASGSPEVLREEFIENLVGCDYGLDVRGDANGSQRLFEILSLGRIPVIIDTERNFPFEREVPYSDFSLRVDFRDISRLADIIADFHGGLSPERFAAMQRAARDAFVRYFRVDALAAHIIDELRAQTI